MRTRDVVDAKDLLGLGADEEERGAVVAEQGRAEAIEAVAMRKRYKTGHAGGFVSHTTC